MITIKRSYKKVSKYLVSFILTVFLLIASGCKDDFQSINTDPNQFTKVQPEYLMTTAVQNSMNLIAQLNSLMYWPYGHQVTISSGDFPGYGSTSDQLNSIWAKFYSTIYLVKDIQKKYANVPGYENRVLIAQVWECYLFYIYSTTFGGIPYTNACRDDITSLPYDSETDIYTSILNRLKESTDKLDPKKDKLAYDVLFPDGDINKWKMFANSLRLKVALEVQNAIPDIAAQHGKEAMANESILPSSNANNIIAHWGGTTTSEYSWYYNQYVLSKTTSDGSKPYLSQTMFTYLRSYGDKRITKYADPTVMPFMISDTLWDGTFTMQAVVRYVIPYNGKPKTTQLAGLDENAESNVLNNPLKSLSDQQFSMVNSQFLAINGSMNIIWYSDVCFMKAEAALLGWGGTKTPDQYYYDGINASYLQYGLTTADATAYENQDGVKWGTARTDAFPDFTGLVNSNISSDPLQKIIVQRWIAGYFHGSHDAWCYIRRTRKIDLPPHMNPGKIISGGQPLIANLPERMQYPISETILNGKAYTDAVAQLGAGDFLPTYLKMALPYNRKSYDQWKATPIFLNHAAYIKWYGMTIDDLTNAGLVMGKDYFVDKVL